MDKITLPSHAKLSDFIAVGDRIDAIMEDYTSQGEDVACRFIDTRTEVADIVIAILEDDYREGEGRGDWFVPSQREAERAASRFAAALTAMGGEEMGLWEAADEFCQTVADDSYATLTPDHVAEAAVLGMMGHGVGIFDNVKPTGQRRADETTLARACRMARYSLEDL